MRRRIVVLIAEDEELIRVVAAEALRDEGFEVIEAIHAEDALNSLETHATVIHVLFTLTFKCRERWMVSPWHITRREGGHGSRY